MNFMSKKVQNEKKNENQKKYDRGQVFVKVMAGFLAALMVLATCGTLIFALMR